MGIHINGAQRDINAAEPAANQPSTPQSTVAAVANPILAPKETWGAWFTRKMTFTAQPILVPEKVEPKENPVQPEVKEIESGGYSLGGLVGRYFFAEEEGIVEPKAAVKKFYPLPEDNTIQPEAKAAEPDVVELDAAEPESNPPQPEGNAAKPEGSAEGTFGARVGQFFFPEEEVEPPVEVKQENPPATLAAKISSYIFPAKAEVKPQDESEKKSTSPGIFGAWFGGKNEEPKADVEKNDGAGTIGAWLAGQLEEDELGVEDAQDSVEEADEESLSWAASSYISHICSDSKNQKRLDELARWLKIRNVDQISNGVAFLLKPLLPKSLNDDQINRIVLMLVHTLAKNSLKDGKTTLADMLLVLTTILKKHAPDIKAKSAEYKFDLEAKSHAFMEPLLEDLVKVLVPRDELTGYGLFKMYNKYTGGAKSESNDPIVDLFANEKVLEFFHQGIIAFENQTDRKALGEQSISILDKMDKAAKPAVEFVQKQLGANQQLVSDELFEQFGFQGEEFKGWWADQVKILIEQKGGGGEVLLTFASDLTRQMLTTIFLRMGGDKRLVREKTVELGLEVIKFGADNADKLWNLDPKADNRELFKPLSKILIEKLFLNDPKTLPLPEVVKPFMLKLIENQLPQLLALSYSKGLLPELKQLGVVPGQVKAIDPTVNGFAKKIGVFTAHQVFNVFLPPEDGTETVSKSIVDAIVDPQNNQFAPFLPTDRRFWSKALYQLLYSQYEIVGGKRVIKASNRVQELKDWTEQYVTHASQTLLQTILDRLLKAEKEKGFSLGFKESTVKLINVYMNERANTPIVSADERMKLVKELSLLLKDVIHLKDSEIPLPLRFQDSLWESWIPKALDQCLVKFCDPVYLRQKLASTIKAIDLKEDEYEEFVKAHPVTPEFERACQEFIGDTALFAKIPFAKFAVGLGFRDKSGHKVILSLLYGVLGKQLMEQLQNWDLSKVMTTALETATTNDALDINAPVVKEKKLDLAQEIMKKVDESLTLKMDTFMSNIHKKIDAFILKWLGPDVLTLKKILQTIINFFLSPLVLFLWLAKKIVFLFVQNRIHFALNKTEDTFDVTILHRILSKLRIDLAAVRVA